MPTVTNLYCSQPGNSRNQSAHCCKNAENLLLFELPLPPLPPLLLPLLLLLACCCILQRAMSAAASPNKSQSVLLSPLSTAEQQTSYCSPSECHGCQGSAPHVGGAEPFLE
jgi:hypothetical protein